jgi:hypothetical protein
VQFCQSAGAVVVACHGLAGEMDYVASQISELVQNGPPLARSRLKGEDCMWLSRIDAARSEATGDSTMAEGSTAFWVA